jgi:membrane protease YdiL (CAAX protease family)
VLHSLAQLTVHLLTAFVVLVSPWLGYLQMQKARKRLQAGEPRVKAGLYRNLVIEQVIVTAVVCWLWIVGVIPATRLGICAPRSWLWTAGLATVLGGLLVQSSLRARPKSQRLREKLKGKIDVLLPESLEEHRWFAAVSVGAGISEELVYRGFLFYYFSVYVIHLNRVEIVLLTSFIFGMGHVYQGFKGVVKTTVVGLILAVFYVLTGSLLLSVILHALVDLQICLIFWPRSHSHATAQEAI